MGHRKISTEAPPANPFRLSFTRILEPCNAVPSSGTIPRCPHGTYFPDKEKNPDAPNPYCTICACQKMKTQPRSKVVVCQHGVFFPEYDPKKPVPNPDCALCADEKDAKPWMLD